MSATSSGPCACQGVFYVQTRARVARDAIAINKRGDSGVEDLFLRSQRLHCQRLSLIACTANPPTKPHRLLRLNCGDDSCPNDTFPILPVQRTLPKVVVSILSLSCCQHFTFPFEHYYILTPGRSAVSRVCLISLLSLPWVISRWKSVLVNLAEFEVCTFY